TTRLSSHAPTRTSRIGTRRPASQSANSARPTLSVWSNTHRHTLPGCSPQASARRSGSSCAAARRVAIGGLIAPPTYRRPPRNPGHPADHPGSDPTRSADRPGSDPTRSVGSRGSDGGELGLGAGGGVGRRAVHAVLRALALLVVGR